MIDKDEAIRLLRKEVANKGANFIYQRLEEGTICAYFEGDNPSCIVGHALAGTEWQERINVASYNTVGIETVRDAFPDMMDLSAERIFAVAQGYQDEGLTWGRALERAEEEYRKLGGTE